MLDFFTVVSVVSAVLSVILFFKVWGMCNDVDHIRTYLKSDSNSFEDITTLILSGNKEEVEQRLNKMLAKTILGLYYTEPSMKDMNDDERLKRRIDTTLERFKPYYAKIGMEIPKQFVNMTAAELGELVEMKKQNNW